MKGTKFNAHKRENILYKFQKSCAVKEELQVFIK